MARIDDQERRRRFWEKVDKRKDNAECWLWTGGVSASGYGFVHVEVQGSLRGLGAHAAAKFYSSGELVARSEGTLWRHSCDIRLCCNPAHILKGTPALNTADAMGRCRLAIGSRHGLAKLNRDDVIEIRTRLKQGVSVTELAADYAVTRKSIRNAAYGRTFRHVAGALKP